MFSSIQSALRKFLRIPNYRTQTFTYYIPAPPSRNTGYREKQFDKVFYQFINQGYEILSFNTQSHQATDQQGFWIIAVVRATNAKANELDFTQNFDSEVNNPIPYKKSSPLKSGIANDAKDDELFVVNHD
jgi:hypothetical protein